MSPDLVLFLERLEAGGAERAMVNLVKGLAHRGIRVELAVARDGGTLAAEVPATVPVTRLGAPRVAASIAPLARLLRARVPRALLATPAHVNVAAAVAHRLAGVSTRLVLREANLPSHKARDARTLRGRTLPRLMRLAYPRADALVAASEDVAADLAATLGVPRASIRVIPNPTVDTEVLARARDRPEHPWLREAGPPVILSVGRLTRQKDHATLLEAFARLRRDRPARLLILGEGEERTALEAQARRLDIAAHVAMPGFAANPFAAMARCAVFALPSAWEGLPNALIQALALGARVVATDAPGGSREVLEGGRLGRLVPVGDAAALARAIAGAMDAPHDPAPGLAHARRYAVEPVVDAYLGVLGLAPAPRRVPEVPA